MKNNVLMKQLLINLFQKTYICTQGLIPAQVPYLFIKVTQCNNRVSFHCIFQSLRLFSMCYIDTVHRRFNGGQDMDLITFLVIKIYQDRHYVYLVI